MANAKYTELQLKIISGEIPLESVNGRIAVQLYKKALANEDVELTEKAQARIVQAKAETSKRNIERTTRNIALRRKGVYQWAQPKTSNYTDYQKLVVRGEIPLAQVLTKDLITIYQKAVLNDDNVLSENIFELISYRREKWLSRDRLRNRYSKKLCSIGDFEDFDINNPLSKWDQAILKGFLNFDDFTEKDLVRIIKILENNGNDEELKTARQLLLYKQDISVVYVTKDHWQAVDLIEELLQLPIRRPDSWFIEE